MTAATDRREPMIDIVPTLVQIRWMDVLTYSDTRANLKAVMDRVVEDHAPVVIARQNGKPVVMVSLEDWSAMEETEYLLANPNNARALREAIARMDAGGGVEHDLIDP
ncbi:type II toxin-antitoxin system Phd/YefM family antitoxin [uncultured Sphingomonas sp.]|uniref:type II toxin-antitoxin system Phd/YefM family antitoxin n=1 Tax=uncultured Sphingomonas sp. TaxID=158754 RepID=UPI0035CA2ACC